MACITEHNAEEEGKRNDSIKRRISLAIRCHTVCINQILKSSRKSVCPVECRGIFIRMDHVEKRWYRIPALLLKKHIPRSFVSCITFWIIYHYDLQIVLQDKNITCSNKLQKNLLVKIKFKDFYYVLLFKTLMIRLFSKYLN